MPRLRPNKKELAKMKVMSDLGQSPSAIAKSLGRSHHTVIKYLRRADFSDPQVQNFIEKIKNCELAELHGIGGKARAILNDYLDGVLDGIREPQPIPITAILDRTFNQRRLLEGTSTQNIDLHAMVAFVKEFEALEKRWADLNKKEGE
jgi:hypothetical protein